MSIPIYREKIKSFFGSEKGKDVFIFAVIVCVAISSFVLGKLSVVESNASKPVVVKFDPSVTDYFYKEGEGGKSNTPALSGSSGQTDDSILDMDIEEVAGETKVNIETEESKMNSIADLQKGDIVASSRGSKYYYVYCSGAKSLSEANKIYFSSEEEAEANGYSLSTSCSKK